MVEELSTDFDVSGSTMRRQNCDVVMAARVGIGINNIWHVKNVIFIKPTDSR